MFRLLIDAVPTPLLLVGGTLLAVGASLVALGLVRRRWPRLHDGAHNDVANAVLAVAGTLHAIILGFVIVNAYGNFVAAQDAVRAEATLLTELYRDTQGITGLGGQVAAAIDGYVHEVVDVEWPALRQGIEPAASANRLDPLYAALHAFESRTDSERAFHAASVGVLNDVLEARRVPLLSAQ